MALLNSTWNLPPPPGFQGLRDDLPVTHYEHFLPHWRQAGATYFVTFRLFDSIPQSKLRELRAFKADWECRHPKPHSNLVLEDYAREIIRRVEGWLDQGMGSCLLKSANVSAILADVLLEQDNQHAELGCFVVMPNHVHAIVQPLIPEVQPLESILK